MADAEGSRIRSDTGPFALIPRWMIDAPVSDGAVRLYAILADHADRDGSCWPGRALLADRLRASKQTVDRRLSELEAAGAIVVHRRGGAPGDPWRSNLYEVRRVDPGLAAEPTPRLRAEPTPSPTDEPPLASQMATEQEPENKSHENKSLAPLVGSDLPASVSSSPHLRDAERLADLLADLIADNGSRRPAVTSTWVRDLERLIRIDGRTAEQVEAAIRWCQQDEFWRANVLSPAKLRKQYDRMRLQAKRAIRAAENRPGSAASMMDVLRQLDDQMEESRASPPHRAIEA